VARTVVLQRVLVAQQESLDEHDAHDLLRHERREEQRDAAATRVAQQREALPAERLDDVQNAVNVI
jgi:hypothetical protein